jgi:hypothetical protein
VGDRIKRTCNLSESTVRRVRELAGDFGVARSQDAVVELAVEQLYAQMRDRYRPVRPAQRHGARA